MNAHYSQQPTILLIEPDDQTRPILKKNLSRWGYRIIIALDPEDALDRMQGKQEIIDVILFNQDGFATEALLSLGREIRQIIHLAWQVPIVVMALRYGEDLEGQDVALGEEQYVSYLEDGQQLRDLLQKLCSNHQ